MTGPGTAALRSVAGVFMLMLMASTAAWAGGQGTTQRSGTAAATQAALALSKQRLEQQQAQVRQLQDTLAKQESDSKQASQRLQQQDQAIAQMQQELQALHAKPAAGQR